MSLQGKVVLVTGSSKGIGKACVERAARDGASVVINYNSDTASAEALVRSIGDDRALAVKADVAKVADVARLVDEAVKKFGRIDVLVANAGIMYLKTCQDATEEDFDTMFNINVKGPYFLTQKAIPHMPSGSRVILVSTSIAHFSLVTPNYGLYVATKGAIEQLTRSLAKELAPKGITTNAIAPGPTNTDLFIRGKPEAVLNTIKGYNPFNRFGEPDEQAGVFAFLAGPDSSWVNGQTLQVNGGQMV